MVPVLDEGGNIDIDEINSIAGDEANVLDAALRGGFDALDDNFAAQITERLCNQPCFNPLHNHPDDARLP